MKVEDVTTEFDNETMTLTMKAKNIECLENKITVTYIEPKGQIKVEKFDMEHKMNLGKLMPHRHTCTEYQVKLEISSVNSTPVWIGLFNSTIPVGLPTVSDGKLEFEIIAEIYKSCKDKANLLLNCTSEDGNITVFENNGLSLEQNRVQGLFCRAKAYINNSDINVQQDLNFKSFSPCFTDTGAPCAEDKSGSPLFVGLGSVGGALAIAFMAVIIAAKIKNRRSVVYHKIKTDFSPSHIIFKNSETLPEDLDTAAALQGEIGEEYKKLESHVQNHIGADETTEVSSSELNIGRNRYKSILPYDSNLVVLSKETGKFSYLYAANFYIL